MRIADEDMGALRDRTESVITVAAAHRAGVFDVLTPDEAVDAATVADRAGLDVRAVEILLPVLAEGGWLERSGGDGGPGGPGEARYRPTEACLRQLCDPEAESWAGGGLPLWLHNLEAWIHLDDVLRTGEPWEAEGGRERDEEGLRRFMAGMAAAPRDRIERLVDGCLGRKPDARTVLDLGGGPGHMSRAFVERGLRATLFDTPETVDFVRREYGLATVEGLETVSGDFVDDALPQGPEGPWDVVLMSNIVHIYGPAANRALLEKAARVVAPGGVVAVADFLRGRSPRADRFALVMLLRTREGDTYSGAEIEGWMGDAGFEEPRVTDLDPERQLVTAIRSRFPGDAA